MAFPGDSAQGGQSQILWSDSKVGGTTVEIGEPGREVVLDTIWCIGHTR
jgi:hypothetical protein